MPSFDTVIEPDLVELKNVAAQVAKEIATRFDFKGSKASCEFTDKSTQERELVLTADSDFQLDQLREVLIAKLARRSVDVRFVDLSAKPIKLGGDRLKLVVPVKSGIASDSAKKIQQLVKASKLKVQAAIQGDAVRITGTKRDDLQAAIAMLRKEIDDLPLAFNNLRD
jgi:cyclic-di-GMP-binding protein